MKQRCVYSQVFETQALPEQDKDKRIAARRLQQWDIVWRNYVHEMFKDRTSEAAVRQRRLALDLSSSTDESIRVSKIPEISTRMAAAYAKKTRKTMVRDVNKLINMGLMERTKEGVRAKLEVIVAFLPAKKFDSNYSL